jgi:hypothetical protein
MPAPPAGPAALVASLPATLGRPLRYCEVALLGWSPHDEEHVAVVTWQSDPADPVEEVSAVRQLVVDGAETAAAVFRAPTAADGEVVLGFVGAVAARYGLDLLDAVVILRDRYRSIACTDPSCCPPEGRPLPTPTEENS